MSAPKIWDQNAGRSRAITRDDIDKLFEVAAHNAEVRMALKFLIGKAVGMTDEDLTGGHGA